MPRAVVAYVTLPAREDDPIEASGYPIGSEEIEEAPRGVLRQRAGA